jgi:DNA invertase Pin-like site-specific DNA recombinase
MAAGGNQLGGPDNKILKLIYPIGQTILSCHADRLFLCSFLEPEQSKGDSLRRQVALAEEYAEQHGLTLDRKLKLTDLGVSSFRGANATTGALSTFLRAITDGKVVPGSVLLVENLDRLSRDEIGNSFELLMGILRQGVEVVTLTDRMRFNWETINANPLPLMVSLFGFYRVHEESALKSHRLSSIWGHKWEHAAEEKMTAKCPAWLTLAADRKSFKVIPERVAIVRQIFKRALDGYGKMAISRHLNESGVKPWGRGHGWYESYIGKILGNRAVLGEFQPHKLLKGKYRPIGSPIWSSIQPGA